MKLALDIARRYLLGRKSTNAINWITWIVIVGMGIGTATMIVSMSIFNGFENLLSGLFNAYNPDYKIAPKEGLYLEVDSAQIAQILALSDVESVSKTVQEVALFEYDGSQEAGIIKGVDRHFTQVTQIDSTLIRGSFTLKDQGADGGVLGIGIFNKLAVNPSDGLTPISVYMPKRKKTGPFEKDFKTQFLYAKGVFSVGNEDDSQVIIADFDFVNSLLDLSDAVSFLELKVRPDSDEKQLRKDIAALLGSNVKIFNRYQQDEAYLKIMNIEKWVTFLLVAVIVLILSFNMVGSLWMIVLDKRKDLSILQSMGMTAGDIGIVFLCLGGLIGLLGILLGISLSLLFYFLQVNFGLLSVPPGFMIDSYPISLKWTDFLVSVLTVLFISFVASILPSLKARKVNAYVRYE